MSEPSEPNRNAQTLRSRLATSRRLVTAAALVSVATGLFTQRSAGSDQWPVRAVPHWAPVSQPVDRESTAPTTSGPVVGGFISQPVASRDLQRALPRDVRITIHTDRSDAPRADTRVWPTTTESSRASGRFDGQPQVAATGTSPYAAPVRERFDRLIATPRPPAGDYSRPDRGGASVMFPSASPSLAPVVSQQLQTQPPRIDAHTQSGTASHAGVSGSYRDSDLGSAGAIKPMWLQSATPIVHRKAAIEAIARATHEYKVRAWASAEASAWQAIELSAEGIDLAVAQSDGPHVAGRYPTAAAAIQATATATGTLSVARNAIREARDFVAVAASDDQEILAGVVRSHQTAVLQGIPASGLARNEAVDRYLNEARVQLGKIASVSLEAAQAMDLLAAIYLGRGDQGKLPGPTSLCLRRAAFKGQPNNGSLASTLGRQLADVGLYTEARWALGHAMQIAPDVPTAEALVGVLGRSGDVNAANRIAAAYLQNTQLASARRSAGRAPAITQVSPQQFAQMSRQYAHIHPNMNATGTAAQTGGGSDARQSESRVVNDDPQPSSTVARVVDSFRKLW